MACGAADKTNVDLKAMEAEVRNKSYVEYETPYTRSDAISESTRCLQCTCEAIGFCDLRRLGIEYGTTLVDEPAWVGTVDKLGVDETSWLAATPSHPTF